MLNPLSLIIESISLIIEFLKKPLKIYYIYDLV